MPPQVRAVGLFSYVDKKADGPNAVKTIAVEEI